MAKLNIVQVHVRTKFIWIIGIFKDKPDWKDMFLVSVWIIRFSNLMWPKSRVLILTRSLSRLISAMSAIHHRLISSSNHHPLLSTWPNVMFKVKFWILVIILRNCLHQNKIFVNFYQQSVRRQVYQHFINFNEAPSRLSDHRFLRTATIYRYMMTSNPEKYNLNSVRHFVSAAEYVVRITAFYKPS